MHCGPTWLVQIPNLFSNATDSHFHSHNCLSLGLSEETVKESTLAPICLDILTPNPPNKLTLYKLNYFKEKLKDM